jgi:hypothetical protein
MPEGKAKHEGSVFGSAPRHLSRYPHHDPESCRRCMRGKRDHEMSEHVKRNVANALFAQGFPIEYTERLLGIRAHNLSKDGQ